jgi:hypothetical protein
MSGKINLISQNDPFRSYARVDCFMIGFWSGTINVKGSQRNLK